MKTLFQAQESSRSTPSQSRKSSARTRIMVWMGILTILGLALREGVVAALSWLIPKYARLFTTRPQRHR
jgi:hypothetical protein